MLRPQVPNQEDLLQQNENALPPNQMNNFVGGVGIAAAPVPQQHNMLNVDDELIRARPFIRERIYALLMLRQLEPVDEPTRLRFENIAQHLEEGLFRAAQTKGEYMDLETLQLRVSDVIKGKSRNYLNQSRQQLVNSTASVGTMIPTSGMTHNRLPMTVGSSIKSSAVAQRVNSTASIGRMIPTPGMIHIRSPWMVASSMHSSTVTASWGSTITPATVAAGGGNTIPPTVVNPGRMLSTGGTQSGSSDGKVD